MLVVRLRQNPIGEQTSPPENSRTRFLPSHGINFNGTRGFLATNLARRIGAPLFFAVKTGHAASRPYTLFEDVLLVE